MDKCFKLVALQKSQNDISYTFILMHATGVCTPTSVVQQIMILHCAMLFMRLLFDLNKNCGIMLE